MKIQTITILNVNKTIKSKNSAATLLDKVGTENSMKNETSG